MDAFKWAVGGIILVGGAWLLMKRGEKKPGGQPGAQGGELEGPPAPEPQSELEKWAAMLGGVAVEAGERLGDERVQAGVSNLAMTAGTAGGKLISGLLAGLSSSGSSAATTVPAQ